MSYHRSSCHFGCHFGLDGISKIIKSKAIKSEGKGRSLQYVLA